MALPHLWMCSGCIVNNGVVDIVYQFESDWDPEDITEADRTELLEARFRMVCFFVGCCLILLDTLLCVNATAYASLVYTGLSWLKLYYSRIHDCIVAFL